MSKLQFFPRLVRVFISSTFRDFIEERDQLVKKVFPELRRRCKERFVELLEVDLRWGITEEQAKSGETLRICLEEIDRCRPSAPVFFIGLLGERYGWIPPKDYFKADILQDRKLGWVKEHIDGKSVTELEILHGVLRSEKMRDKAFFYFRRDGYQDRHWDRIKKDHAAMRPPVVITKEDFTNAGSERGQEADDAKQRQLKQAVRDASLTWDPRDYETSHQMGEMVLEDLWKVIDRAFPAQSVPGETERRRLEHEVFGRSRVAGYVPRPGLFDQLDRVLTDPSPAIRVVSGESGSGKSALLAAWLDYMGERAPESRFVHYIGGTPESSTARSIVMRLLAEIRDWGAVNDPVPEDFHEAVQVLPQWLERAAQKDQGGVLLVLDALNQLEDASDQRLSWLPRQLPPGVRLVVSTLAGPAEDELRARGWMENTVAVPPLEPGERRGIIEKFLREGGKDPAALPVDKLATAPQSANALYLRVVLNELKMRASFGKVDTLLDDLLLAKDPSELFVRVLKNLEEFDRDRPALVCESLGYLGLARRGLTEGELLELLSKNPQPSSSPLPRHYWSPLYLALADSLVSRNGQLGFFHDYLRQAVDNEYLNEEHARQNIHQRLGQVALNWNTGKFGDTLRAYGLEHGVWHLLQAGEVEAAASLCLDDGFMEAVRREAETLAGYLLSVQEATEAVADLCRRNKSLEPFLCRLALRQGYLRHVLVRHFAGEHQLPRLLEPLEVERCAKASLTLDEHHRWFYALGVLADAAERGATPEALANAQKVLVSYLPESIDFSSNSRHNAYSHFDRKKEIQEVRELLIPELLARAAACDHESACQLLSRLDDGSKINFLCRTVMRLVKKGYTAIAEKILGHSVAGNLFDADRIADPVFAMPVLWALQVAADGSKSARSDQLVDRFTAGVTAVLGDSHDPWQMLSLCLSGIVNLGFAPPPLLHDELMELWNKAPYGEDKAHGTLRYDMETTKERELDAFDEQDIELLMSMEGQDQRKSLEARKPDFSVWWAAEGRARELPDWLDLSSRALSTCLLKHADPGSKEALGMRSSGHFSESLILFYRESSKLGALSHSDMRALVAKLTGRDDKLEVIKQLASDGRADGDIANLNAVHEAPDGRRETSSSDRSRWSPYDSFRGPLDYWSAAGAALGLIATKMHVEGVAPAELMETLEEFDINGENDRTTH